MDAHRTRLLNIMHVVPLQRSDNAGQNYASRQVSRWAQKSDLSCLVIPGRSMREHLSEAILPTVPLKESHTGRSTPFRSVWWKLRAWFPTLPDLAVADALREDPNARKLIESADVIVLQWQQTAAQAGVVRSLNPTARRVVVLHDVMSQSHRRYARHATSRRQRLRHAVATQVSRAVEARIARLADLIVVPSHKDEELLPRWSRNKVCVVPAPITVPENPIRTPVDGRVVLVSSWREENVQGLEWFDREVLPHVRARFSDVQIHLIGRMSPTLASEWQSRGYTVRGFVDDLSQEYARAAVAAVPLWLGAGVKFKTVEAGLHAVPLVSTSVGAEGIPALAGRSEVTDDPTQFAAALVQALTMSQSAQRAADALRVRILDDHSPEAIDTALDQVLRRVQNRRQESEHLV